MLSFHEKWFERRWYGFKPRSRKIALIAYSAFALCIASVFAAIVLADEHAWAPLLAIPAVVLFLINIGLGLGRTDW